MPNIEHVIVLMLENRSFDNMLGALYAKDPSFEGLSGIETNNWLSQPVPVWSSPMTPLDALAAQIPTPDPGELFTDMNTQLFNGPRPGTPAVPAMSGFVQNYMSQNPRPESCQAVMHYFKPEQVPVISTLAKAFGVCDQWHASAPCQTWPNRFFAHTATSLGYVDNHNFPVPFPAPSIYRRLTQFGAPWRVYYHDVPQSILIRDIWLQAPQHFRPFKSFLSDAINGALPNYSFIEPRYFSDLLLNEIPNDEHPPHNVLYGEKLIADVYNAIRNSPCWKKCLFIVTYDEHGGCFDHVPPPAAVPPDSNQPNGFAFDTYGVRVPAVIVSPYIPPGSRIRSAPAGLPPVGPPYPFDHTSIIATLRRLFDLGIPLTQRDAVAPDLIASLSLPAPLNDGPSRILVDAPPPPIAEVAALASAPPNSLQAALTRMASLLPSRSYTPAAMLTAPLPLQAPVPETVARARSNAVLNICDFLGL